MRTLSTLFIAALIGLVSCGGEDSAAVGTWTFDYDASAKLIETGLERVAKGPARAKLRQDALDFLKRHIGNLEITLELKDGGEAEFIQKGRGPDRRFVGNWSRGSKKDEIVVSAAGQSERYRLDGDTLRFQIEVEETDGAGKQVVELVLKRG